MMELNDWGEERQRPPTSSEHVRQRARERVLEMQGYRAWQAERAERVGGARVPGPRASRARGTTSSQYKKVKTIIDEWAELEWERRWKKKARNQKAATWKMPWEDCALKLYSDLPKHQATALFLLRTEILGLNDWLASINVPGISADCGCGWSRQTVHHILMFCPLYTNRRVNLVRRTRSEEMWRMLSSPEKVQATARWFI